MVKDTQLDQVPGESYGSVDDGEHMLEPVPMHRRRSTYSQIMVWIGFGYVVTGLFVGGTLAGYGGGVACRWAKRHWPLPWAWGRCS